MAQACCEVIGDFLWGPYIERWTAELTHTRDCLIEDYEHIRKYRSVIRRRPEKGIVRLALVAFWVVVHLYALIVLAAYHAFHHGPVSGRESTSAARQKKAACRQLWFLASR